MQITNESKCSFCYPSSKQAKILMVSTLKKMKIILNKKKQQEDVYISSQYQNTFNNDYFINLNRLIKVIYHNSKYMSLSSYNSCKHEKMISFMISKLKCKISQLEELVQELCDKIAKRNYQLQVLAYQVHILLTKFKNIQEKLIDYRLQGFQSLDQGHVKKEVNISSKHKLQEKQILCNYQLSSLNKKSKESEFSSDQIPLQAEQNHTRKVDRRRTTAQQPKEEESHNQRENNPVQRENTSQPIQQANYLQPLMFDPSQYYNYMFYNPFYQ